MSYAPDYSHSRDLFAIEAAADERVAFLRRTYAHLFAAVTAFTGLVALFVNTDVVAAPMFSLIQNGQWWLILVLFLAASWGAQWMAHSGASPAVQYCGLGLYTVAEAIVFTPLLYFLNQMPGGANIMLQAGALTLIIFGGLTAVVMLTGADFSFLRTVLWVAGIAAFGLVLVAAFTGFSLGLWFVVGMIVLMCGYILYDTSNVLHHFRTDQHVAASLELFASLATLFWYVLRLMMILNSRD
jgi:hypothetical protein